MRDNLMAIEDRLVRLRGNSAVFQDNTDLVKEKFELFRDTFITQLDDIKNPIDINVFIDKDELEINKPMVYFECIIPKGYPLKVYIPESQDNGVTNDILLHTLEYPWGITV